MLHLSVAKQSTMHADFRTLKNPQKQRLTSLFESGLLSASVAFWVRAHARLSQRALDLRSQRRRFRLRRKA
ncbi:MAG TPA: hypothetical protein VHM19_22795, partial [Polyangiales bacterium]|nr:hypothetical protein [Polyangiales bacterium]